MSELKVRVCRHAASLKPKRDPEAEDSWGNNDANNSLDTFELYTAGRILLACRVQTVVNVPGGRFKDTVAPGRFQLKAFVEPRKFCGRIHGICNTRDLEGQLIDQKSIQPYPLEPPGVAGKNGEMYAPADENRYLVHDRRKPQPNPSGELTRVAWSAGCFVMWQPASLEALGDLLVEHGVRPGDLIDGELIQWG